ncbi:uncharacterized protein LOC130220806 [Danio aesculapii]|uniref:uncharacterized protein LOC130220806 n=1 Tax=Danio aesculapii TaxID=1142201 RepID=UPI0024C07F4B|nr:uncharacterized protein LOC130220806 [Danio aesculapii]
MADRSPLFLLLIFWTLSTGVFGAGETDVFSRSGETVHLLCRNTVQYCRPSETVWLYSSYRQRETLTPTVELITLGVTKKDTGKHERLNLGSDCSLIISRVTTEDAGRYICQQWTGDKKDRLYAQVSMYLDVVAAKTQTTTTTTTTTTTAAAAAAAVTPDHNTNTSVSSSAAVSVIVAVVAVFALLFSALIVWLIHNRLADTEEEDCDSSLLTSVVFSETPAENMWKRMKYSV